MSDNFIKSEIMTLEEVADYLRLTQSDVIKFAKDGEIPSAQLANSWRFRRVDVDKWLEEKIGSNHETLSAEKNVDVVKLSDLLTEDTIIICDDDNKKDFLNRMIDVCAKDYSEAQKAALSEGIFAREQLMSTAIGLGVAIPHVRIKLVTELKLVMCLSRELISDYEGIDQIPVRLAFMIVAHCDQHALHLRTLSAISGILKDHALRQRIINSNSPSEILQLINNYEHSCK